MRVTFGCAPPSKWLSAPDLCLPFCLEHWSLQTLLSCDGEPLFHSALAPCAALPGIWSSSGSVAGAASFSPFHHPSALESCVECRTDDAESSIDCWFSMCSILWISLPILKPCLHQCFLFSFSSLYDSCVRSTDSSGLALKSKGILKCCEGHYWYLTQTTLLNWLKIKHPESFPLTLYGCRLRTNFKTS